jgi:hypothetical protein
MVPDLADPGKLTTALPLNEMQAAMDQAAPVATVPVRDPMTRDGADLSLTKLNLYRTGVDQPPVVSLDQARVDQRVYCQNLFQIAPARLLRDMALTQVAASPVPLAANNLFTFLAQRFNFTVSNQGLDCSELVDQRSPITLRRNERGVAVAATIHLATTTTAAPSAPAATAPVTAPVTAPTATGTPAATATAEPPMPVTTPAGGGDGDHDHDHGGNAARGAGQVGDTWRVS